MLARLMPSFRAWAWQELCHYPCPRCDWGCCRVFCQLLRPDLDRVLAQQPPARGPLLDLFYAVHQLEKRADRLYPAALGELCIHMSSLPCCQLCDLLLRPRPRSRLAPPGTGALPRLHCKQTLLVR